MREIEDTQYIYLEDVDLELNIGWTAECGYVGRYRPATLEEPEETPEFEIENVVPDVDAIDDMIKALEKLKEELLDDSSSWITDEDIQKAYDNEY